MKLRETILKAHSKANCNRIVKWVGDDQTRFDELFNLFLNDEYRVVQRAGWPITYCVEMHPSFLKKHFAPLLKNLKKKGIHDAVKRNTVRLLQFVNIPKKYQGDVMNICFQYIASPSEAIAIKAFSLNVLHKLSNIYPEIKSEIRLIVEERWNYETPAFKSRAKKII